MILNLLFKKINFQDFLYVPEVQNKSSLSVGRAYLCLRAYAHALNMSLGTLITRRIFLPTSIAIILRDNIPLSNL